MKACAGQAHATRLLDLIGANWTTQAIGAAVTVGVVDGLAQARRSAAALAARIRCDPGALQRLLRALSAIGICERQRDGRYALTPMGALLREDAPGSVRRWAQWCGGPQWTLWGALAQCVRSGRSARRTPGYAHLVDDDAAAAMFHQAMAGLTGRIGRAVAQQVDWRAARCVVDVGGGYGELLAEVLAAQPSLRGILFDQPHATRGAAKHLARAGLARRCTVRAGSFFDHVPPGGDVYLAKSILHNWSDLDAQRILARCRAAMHLQARLLLIERLLPARLNGGRRARAILRSDLNMLVSLGGRERTLGELGALARAAGFGRPRLCGAALDYSLIELLPGDGSRASAGAATGGRSGRDTRARSRGR